MVSDSRDLVSRALPKMVQALAHRGPDDQGVSYHPFGSQFLGLGMRRLSILDLSAAGHQPMVHPRSGSCLVFNGEIYNFRRLRPELETGHTIDSSGDTGVLLEALEKYGAGCLNRLEGMFAFAWFDARTCSLLLARDALGIKPLYVYRGPGLLLFSSEIRSLLASDLVPRRLDRRGLASFLAYGAVQQPYTMLESVTALRPGHGTVWDAETPQERSRSFFRFPRPESSWSEARAVDAVRSGVEEAVRDHLVSDVPVGVFLSSGLDSTIVATLAARHAVGLRSFTVGFTDHVETSEFELAAETAKLVGLEHTEVLINEPDAQGQAVRWLDSLDQPSIDGLNIYVVSQAVRASGIKVALSGQGGDELFGGYPSFRDIRSLARLVGLAGWLPGMARRLLFRAAQVGRNSAVRDKIADIGAGGGTLTDLYFQRRRLLSDRQMRRLGFPVELPEFAPHFVAQEALDAMQPDDSDPVWMIAQLECRFYQGNMLLPDGDINSMAHGVELRVPLLDRRLVELAQSIPGPVRLPAGEANKYLLRRAFGAELRPALLRQRKKGFSLPLNEWMRGDLRPLCEDSMKTLHDTGVLRSEGITDVWEGFLRQPNSPMWSRALALVTLGHYLGRTGIS